MTVDSVDRRAPNRYVTAPKSGTLAEVIDLILDKGLVIDVFVRVSLVGIEILRVDARVVVASVDTYLRFAEAAGRLDLDQRRDPGLPDLVDRVGSAAKGGAVSGIASGIARGAAGALSGAVSGDRDKVEQRDKPGHPPPARGRDPRRGTGVGRHDPRRLVPRRQSPR